MRWLSVPSVLVLCLTAPVAGGALAQPAVPAHGATGPMAATKTPDLAEVRVVIAAAREQVAKLDQVIAGQDKKLEALYARRDAALSGGDVETQRRLDAVIDTMTLALDGLEDERDRMNASLETLQDQFTALAAGQAEGHEE